MQENFQILALAHFFT